MEFWHFAVLVNAVVAGCYLAIALVVGRGIHRTGQWQANPLAVATFLIFLSCGIGHGTHVEHLLIADEVGLSSRGAFDWHLVTVDLVTAFIAIGYFALRRRFPALLHGAAMYEDLDARRAQALNIQDNIVQQLATAKMALETGHTELGMRTLEGGLEASKAIISRLVGDPMDADATRGPGTLRREVARSDHGPGNSPHG